MLEGRVYLVVSCCTLSLRPASAHSLETDMRYLFPLLLMLTSGCASRVAPLSTQIPDLRPLAAGDRLHWQLGCDRNGIDLAVGDDGCADLPHLGKIRIGGLTLKEANHTILMSWRGRGMYCDVDEYNFTLRRL